jgi:hypothetical protein
MLGHRMGVSESRISVAEAERDSDVRGHVSLPSLLPAIQAEIDALERELDELDAADRRLGERPQLRVLPGGREAVYAWRVSLSFRLQLQHADVERRRDAREPIGTERELPSLELVDVRAFHPGLLG